LCSKGKQSQAKPQNPESSCTATQHPTPIRITINIKPITIQGTHTVLALDVVKKRRKYTSTKLCHLHTNTHTVLALDVVKSEGNTLAQNSHLHTNTHTCW
jgi:hypothetical protein